MVVVIVRVWMRRGFGGEHRHFLIAKSWQSNSGKLSFVSITPGLLTS